jgi:hypothetical protein
MKKLLIALSVLATVSACQKENSLETKGNATDNGSGNPNGTRLVQLGARVGSDTITTQFSYNTANLLSLISYSGLVSGQSANSQIRIVRNASNVIRSLIVKADVFAAIGLDSVVKNFVYDAAKGQYSYSVAAYTFMGVLTSDSTIFNYDATGKLQSVENYHDEGSGYELDSKEEYSYSGNNLASTKLYTFDGSVFELEQTTTYDQYDDKINPLQFQADAPVLGMTTHYSANNIVKQTTTDHASAESITGTFTFTYNAVNRPTRSMSTNGMASALTTYVYQ